MSTGNTGRPLVSVVDDDESVRESLPDLLEDFGFATRTFASAEDFLSSTHIEETQCLILDIVMPGLTGPELQRELILRGHAIPTIFITAQPEQSLPPDLLAHGAVDCLFKPLRDEELRAALDDAFSRDKG